MARLVRKTYGTLGRISYSVGLPLKPGKKAFVTFEGGQTFPKFRPSKFVTTDPEVQAALEKYSHFNKKYNLLSTEEVKEEEAGEAPAVGGDAEDPGDKPAPTEGGVKLKSLQNTSIESAIQTLIKQGWEGDPDTLVTADDVNAAALTIGITFPKIK